MTVERIERDDGAIADAEFGEQRLCCGDFIGFLGDIDMREHQCGVGRESAEHLRGGPVIEIIEAATEGFAIESDAAVSGCGVCGL